jgi:glycine/serine hydroxymethyltransferase
LISLLEDSKYHTLFVTECCSLTHGYQTDKKKISATSIYFESKPYKVSNQTGYIDYDALEENATSFKPKLLICGGSAYPRDYDYARLRQIADKVGAYLLCDMAHFSGLVLSNVCQYKLHSNIWRKSETHSITVT